MESGLSCNRLLLSTGVYDKLSISILCLFMPPTYQQCRMIFHNNYKILGHLATA